MLRNYTVLQHQLAIRANASMRMPSIIPRITTRCFSVSQWYQNTTDEKPPANNNETAKDEVKEKEGEAAAAEPAPEAKASSTDATITSTEEELKAVSLKLKEIQVI